MTDIIKQMSSRNDQKKILVENYLCHSSMRTNVYQVRCVQTLGIFFLVMIITIIIFIIIITIIIFFLPAQFHRIQASQFHSA